jgi:hypothetical protein
MRIQAKYPTQNWNQICENISRKSAARSPKMAHDKVGKLERLQTINLQPSDQRPNWKQTDTLLHRLKKKQRTGCKEGPP